jgi:hypothetical protein
MDGLRITRLRDLPPGRDRIEADLRSTSASGWSEDLN